MSSAQIEVFEMQLAKGMHDDHQIEKRTRDLWEQDAAMREEFGDVESALAYFRAVARGSVKILGRGAEHA